MNPLLAKLRSQEPIRARSVGASEPVTTTVLSGSVQFDFKKRAATESKSHLGVWLESQLEGEADVWTGIIEVVFAG